MTDHVCEDHVRKYGFRHICYQTGIDVNSRYVGGSERFGIFDTR